MKLEKRSLEILKEALDKLGEGFNLPDTGNNFNYDSIRVAILKTAERMQDNYPYFHPFYAGQMLKPPHPVARIAYMLAMWINPNNHALDGGRASSAMEKEAVRDIARMFEWEEHLGHLTGGGTMANLEALWIAGKTNPKKYIVASDQAHYTHERISEVLKLKFLKVKTDIRGRIDIAHLEEILNEYSVGTVVATMGTTGTGAVDPLAELLELQGEYCFRIHADAAYGGYFRLIENLTEENIENFELLRYADSIVIDPHKHGLQPYGCGCVIFRDPSVAKHYLHDSPYTYYSSNDVHLGEISLECSRPGAAATGLWATHQMLPPVPGGEFAADLEKSRRAALDLYWKLSHDGRFLTFFEPELDIVLFAPKGNSTEDISSKSKVYFKKAEEMQLYLSLFKYPAAKAAELWPDVEINSDYVSCLRTCLMKPDHLDRLDELWQKMIEAEGRIR